MTKTNLTDRLLSRLRNTSRRAQLDQPLWALVTDGELARSSRSIPYIFSTRAKAEKVRSELLRDGVEVSVARFVTV